MILSQPLQTNEQKQELIPNESEETSYGCFYRELDDCTGRSVSWHWHSEMEVDYIVEGEIEYRTTDKKMIAHKGELVFLNSNVLHTVAAADRKSGCKLYAHLFNVSFLAGTYNNHLTEKYFLPVVRNQGLDIIKLCVEDSIYSRIETSFLHAVELSREESFGYEFEVRAELSRLWVALWDAFRQIPQISANEKAEDIERIKKMIAYIHKNYAEDVTLEKIAGAASISCRECTRCFQRNIHISPVKYLNKYRIQMAVQMLVETSDSILNISENSGFSSSSYFGKAFREMMGCTPKEFRRNHGKYKTLF